MVNGVVSYEKINYNLNDQGETMDLILNEFQS